MSITSEEFEKIRPINCESYEADKPFGEYGCFVDNCEGDGCVFDSVDNLTVDDCDIAIKLSEQGRGRNNCEFWNKIIPKQDEDISLSLKEAVKEFFSYLDYTEESDSGKEFHPITIGCCRTYLMDKVDNCLKRMKEIVKE